MSATGGEVARKAIAGRLNTGLDEFEAGKVTTDQRQLDHLLGVDDVVELHVRGVDLDGVRSDLESLRLAADLKLHRLHILLVDVDDDAGGHERFEAGRADRDAVGADRKLGEEIVAIRQRLGLELDARGGVRRGHIDPREDGTGRIRDGTFNTAVYIDGVG